MSFLFYLFFLVAYLIIISILFMLYGWYGELKIFKESQNSVHYLYNDDDDTRCRQVSGHTLHIASPFHKRKPNGVEA